MEHKKKGFVFILLDLNGLAEMSWHEDYKRSSIILFS